MKCFHYFKDRTRSREQRSAPILNYHSKSDTSSDEQQRVTKSSSCSATSPRRESKLFEQKSQKLRIFQFSELKQATNGFSRQLKIGEGGFGCVYKGSIKPVDGKGDPTVVAIKMLNKDGFQGHKQWVAEVQFLGIVEHPNLVKLIGYCAVDGERGIQRLLVYEFMANNSLEDHLFNKDFPTLPWKTRLEIAIGAAQGLAYLHEELYVQVIYRDFKSSNVLLDGDFKPKLSDFGLAREGPAVGHTHVSTAVMGTFGYAAPDYIETGHLTCKSDVWSFGVVLYEILTGRRSLERNRPKPEQQLLEWVRHYPPETKKFGMLMDSRLESKYSLTAAKRTAKLAEICLSRNSKDRPKMSEVVESLKQILEVSEVESPSRDRLMGCNNEAGELEKKANQTKASESAKKRIAHLAKLSEHVGGVSMRRFMIMQRGKVPVP